MTFAISDLAPALPLDPDGELEDVILRTESDAGYEQTRPKFTRARRSFGVTFSLLGSTDIANLKTYEQSTLINGSASFSWTHPKNGSTYTVRLAQPIKYSRTKLANYTDAYLLLREV